MKKTFLSLLSFLLFTCSHAQISGYKTIPGDFATLNAAIQALNAQGVGTGGVIIDLLGGNPQTAPAGGYVIGNTGSLILSTSSAANPIRFQGNLNTITAFTPQTVGNINDAIFKIIGADYITLNGFIMQENAANTISGSAGTNNMTEFGVALFYETNTNGAQNNTIQSNFISLNRSYLNTFGIFSTAASNSTALTTAFSASSPAGANSNNKVYGNNISNVNYAVLFIGASTAANMDTGNDIGGTSAGQGNTITNFGGGVALSAYSDLSGNTNYAIYSNKQINDNISFNNITSALLTSAFTEGGIFKRYTTNPAGTITTTINSNTITITNNPSTAANGSIAGITSSGISPVLTTASITINNNAIQNSILGGATATISGMALISQSSSVGTVNITGNSLLNNGITATTSNGGNILGITNNGASATVNITNNIMRGFSNSSPANFTGGLVAISANGAFTTALNVTGNQLGNAAGDLANFTNAPSGIIRPIEIGGAIAASAVLTVSNNVIKGLNLVTSTELTGIRILGNVLSGSITINNNSFGTATGNYYNYSGASTNQISGIINEGGSSTGSLTVTGNDFRSFIHAVTASSDIIPIVNYFGNFTQTITNNTFTNLSLNTTGIVFLINDDTNIPNGGTQNISNNSVVTALNVTGAGGFFTAIHGSGSANTATITWNNNNFSNITLTGATGANVIDNENAGTANHTITGNTINNLTTGAGAVIGILSDRGGANAGGNVITGNTVTNITGGDIIVGIQNGPVSSSNNISGNIIGVLASSGAAPVQGIISGGTVATSISRNKIYDLSNSNAAGTVDGIAIYKGASHTVFNNLIGNLTAPAANAANPVNGLNITNSTAGEVINVYFNTIYLNAASTGTVFGSSAVFASVVPTVTFINNIFVNHSVAKSTGFSVASRRSATDLTTYGSASNNNDFNFNTGTATTLIYYDGTNADQTLAAYKARVASRDAASISTDPVFTSLVGTNSQFLHLDPLSGNNIPYDNGGIPVSGITTDYDLQTRNASTPDIGADEFTFGVLAVGVEYFRGSKVGGANFLDWKINCSSDPSVRIILERSADSRNFKSIQDQTATAVRCAQGFNYTDSSPLAGINYYRLKTISPDGAFKYSSVIALLNKEKGFELISVAPNPVKDNATLTLTCVKGGKMTFAVSNLTGKVIMTQSLNVIAGNNPIPMNFAKLGAGTYNIKVMNGDNEIKSTRFVKY